jgi:hypothetical protein
MKPTRTVSALRGILPAAALALSAPAAHAQAGSPNVVIAEKLFREGQDLLEASKTDDSKTHMACEKFAESERLRPALGTLLNLAVCHEKEKKTASAWAEYTEVAGQATRAGQSDRAQFATQHAAALEPQLCRLRLEMSAPPLSTEVKIDGQPLGAAIWGTDIPLDPGTHAIVVSAPGKQPWLRTITLGPGQTMDREEVPPLLDDTSAPKGAPPPDAHTLRADNATVPEGRGPLPYVLGGAGIAADVVGGVLIGRGAAYSSQSSDETSKAATLTGVNHTNYVNAASSDSSAGTSNTVAGAVVGGLGLVSAGIGIYLLVKSPSKEEPPKAGALRFLPDVGPRRAGGSVGFVF